MNIQVYIYRCTNDKATILIIFLFSEPGEPEDEETQIVRRDLIGVLETMCSKSFKYKKYVSVTGHIKFEVDGKTHTNIFLKEKYSRKMKYERPYKCDTCGRSFRLRNSLLGHEKAHQTAKLEYGDVMKGDLYVCQICNKTFTTRKYWKRHLNIHTEMGKRYQCQFCEKAFQTRSVRAKHELTHSGAKPFECHICGKKMTQKSTLKTHLLTHTEQKPFRCHLCGKGCVKMYELECHLRMHTGDRPFRCSICDKGFVRNYQLQQHIKQSGHENSMQTAVVLQTASTDDVKDVSTESIDEAAVCHLQHIIQLPGTGQNENISQTQLQPGQENIQPHIEQIQQQTDSVQNQMEYNVYNIGSQNQGTATPLNAQPLQGQAVAVTSDEGTFYVLVDSTSTGTGPTVACVQNIVNHKGNENIHN